MDITPLTWPNGIKKTKQRVSVYSILEQAKQPVSANDICKLTEQSDCPVWLSTVYRVLELFVKEHIVIKTTLADTDMALYELNRNQHKHYAVCLGCHKVVEMDNCPFHEFDPQLSDQGFHVLGHKLELYGYCLECEKSKNKEQVK